MTRTKIIAALALFALLGLLGAGCGGAGLPADVGSLRPAKWTCKAERNDDACVLCQRASCCAENAACFANPDCAVMLACTITHQTLCGNGTAEGVEKLIEERACWDAHCADVCPKISGGST